MAPFVSDTLLVILFHNSNCAAKSSEVVSRRGSLRIFKAVFVFFAIQLKANLVVAWRRDRAFSGTSLSASKRFIAFSFQRLVNFYFRAGIMNIPGKLLCYNTKVNRFIRWRNIYYTIRPDWKKRTRRVSQFQPQLQQLPIKMTNET